ncbi:MAG: hypothetical protein LUM44_14775 [Pyrinomonadaceae bacterium]|nr:hypothetical protein [Pyrinomonadaceae bacterium]
MNNHIKRYHKSFIGIRQFGLDNSADFPAGSIGALQFAEISAVIDLINQLAGEQVQGFGDARFAFNSKAVARDELRGEMDGIADIAPSMAYEFPGIELKFRYRRNLSDADLLAKARAFHAEAQAYKDDFIRYELNSRFLENLLAAIEFFENSLGAPATATAEQVAATAELDAALRRGMIARNILNGVVKQKYKNNVGKLNAWKSASHIERTGKKDDGTDNG